MNIRSLKRSIRLDDEMACMGFEKKFLDSLDSRIRAGDGKDFTLPFEKVFDGVTAEGHAFFEFWMVNGLHRLKVFSIKLGEAAKGVIRENRFLRAGDQLCLREGFNLMEGRWVYREPWFDPAGRGYWISLDPVKTDAGIYPIKYLRNAFKMEDAVEDSYLAKWMTCRDQEKLCEWLGQGARVKVAAGPDRGPVLIVANPVEQVLRMTDWKGEETEFDYDDGLWEKR